MVATVQNIAAEQGARLLVTLTGAPGTLTGRNLVMHVRASYDDIATKLTASSSDGRLVVASASTATLDIGSDLMAAVRVDQPEEVWVYDVESYTTSTDGRREWSGSFAISRDATRDTEADLENRLAGLVRYDSPQALTSAQQLQARENIGVTGGGGGGSGDVVGPASATDDRIAAFDGVTGKLIKQGSVTATAVASHIGSTSNPHSVTAAQVGADPTGTAAAAVVAHVGATDPHGDRAFATSAVSTHSALTTGAHGITAAGAALLDDADAAAQRTTLGLGTAATQASGAFEASGAVSTHNAVTTAHGISAFGATLVDDASASVARTTLGLGTAATTAATDYATAAQGTDDRTASGLRTASTVVAISSATAPSSGQVLTATSTTAATWQTPSGGGGSPAGSGTELQYRDGSALGAVPGSSVDATNGRIGLGTSSPAAVLHAVADSASEVALIAQAASGATANIQQWRNSSGTVLGYINAAGEFVGILTRGNGYLDLNDGWSHTIGITISGATYVAIRGGPHGWYSQFFEAHAESASYGVRHRSYAGETEQHFGGATCSGDAVAERVSVRGHDAKPSASTNLIGGDLYLVGGAGASASSGNAHGGNVYLRGGTKYGTGHNGYLIADNLPTSAAGLPTGAIWNDAGTLKVA